MLSCLQFQLPCCDYLFHNSLGEVEPEDSLLTRVNSCFQSYITILPFYSCLELSYKAAFFIGRSCYFWFCSQTLVSKFVVIMSVFFLALFIKRMNKEKKINSLEISHASSFITDSRSDVFHLRIQKSIGSLSEIRMPHLTYLELVDCHVLLSRPGMIFPCLKEVKLIRTDLGLDLLKMLSHVKKWHFEEICFHKDVFRYLPKNGDFTFKNLCFNGDEDFEALQSQNFILDHVTSIDSHQASLLESLDVDLKSSTKRHSYSFHVHTSLKNCSLRNVTQLDLEDLSLNIQKLSLKQSQLLPQVFLDVSRFSYLLELIIEGPGMQVTTLNLRYLKKMELSSIVLDNSLKLDSLISLQEITLKSMSILVTHFNQLTSCHQLRRITLENIQNSRNTIYDPKYFQFEKFLNLESLKIDRSKELSLNYLQKIPTRISSNEKGLLPEIFLDGENCYQKKILFSIRE